MMPSRRIGETGYLSTVSGIAALALAAQDRYDEAEVYVDEAKALGADDDVSTQTYWRAAQRESPRRARGPRRRPATLAEESLALLGPTTARSTSDILCVNAADVYRRQAATDEARRLLEQAIERARAKGHRPRRGLDAGAARRALEVVRAGVDVLQVLDPVDVRTRLGELDAFALGAPAVDVLLARVVRSERVLLVAVLVEQVP